MNVECMVELNLILSIAVNACCGFDLKDTFVICPLTENILTAACSFNKTKSFLGRFQLGRFCHLSRDRIKVKTFG